MIDATLEKTLCKAMVVQQNKYPKRIAQCSRMGRYDGFCHQHTPEAMQESQRKAMAAKGGWQTIDTVPKDDEILVYNKMVGVYQTQQTGGEFPCLYWGGTGVWFPRPTHWMPLPDPPETAQ